MSIKDIRLVCFFMDFQRGTEVRNSDFDSRLIEEMKMRKTCEMFYTYSQSIRACADPSDFLAVSMVYVLSRVGQSLAVPVAKSFETGKGV